MEAPHYKTDSLSWPINNSLNGGIEAGIFVGIYTVKTKIILFILVF